MGRRRRAARSRACSDAVLELEYTLIPHGLHVVGQAPTAAERVDLLLSLAEASHGARPARAAIEALVAGARARGGAGRGRRTRADAATLTLLAELADAPTCCWPKTTRSTAMLRALDGRFLRPAPGGDLLRTPAILPTGRNLHGFDPFRIPSAFAVQDGARQAARLLDKRHAPTATRFPSRSRWCSGAPTT